MQAAACEEEDDNYGKRIMIDVNARPDKALDAAVRAMLWHACIMARVWNRVGLDSTVDAGQEVAERRQGRVAKSRSARRTLAKHQVANAVLSDGASSWSSVVTGNTDAAAMGTSHFAGAQQASVRMLATGSR